jgi:hypothetical protein
MPPQPILKKMMDRLFAALVNGPNLNCRPHSSRQRLELIRLNKLQSQSSEEILRALFSDERSCKVLAQVRPPKQKGTDVEKEEAPAEESDDKKAERKLRQEYSEQTTVLNKLRGIVEDARTYENDTGARVLQLGFPLLSLPPGTSGMPGMTRRILAPLAFIPLSISLATGTRPSVKLECRGEGENLVVPNVALLAWLERQTGNAPKDLLADDQGTNPWHEIASIVKAVCGQLTIEAPAMFRDGDVLSRALAFQAAPKADTAADEAGVVPAAVIGLFPMSNQGLLGDTQALIEKGDHSGPILKFLEADPTLEVRIEARPEMPILKQARQFSDERLVTYADPCQSRAVKMSRTSKGLVIHGPPGTGKSQTITNIIGDHLARGQRVLFVCDKRTALDVVQNRLESLGLGSFCAIVHDPQRDQRDLYKSIREQLDTLTDLRTDSSAEGQLRRVDAELQQLHSELTDFHRSLMTRPDKDSLSFHELVGQWLALPSFKIEFDGNLVHGIRVAAIESSSRMIADVLDRSAKAKFSTNPWSAAAGMPLESFLATPVPEHRAKFQAIVDGVNAIAQVPRGMVPPFPVGQDLTVLGKARADLARLFEKIMSEVRTSLRGRWSGADAEKIRQARQRIADGASLFAGVEGEPLDSELLTLVRSEVPTLSTVAQQVVAVSAYLESAKKWFGFLYFGKKKAAEAVLTKYGLTLSADNGKRLFRFLTGLKFRLSAKALFDSVGHAFPSLLPDDSDLLSLSRMHTSLFDFLKKLRSEPAVADVAPAVLDALKAKELPKALLKGLKESPAHVVKIVRCEQAIRIPLLSKDQQDRLIGHLRADTPPLKELQALADRFDSVESILRVKHGLRTLGGALGKCLVPLIKQGVSSDAGLKILKKASLAAAIGSRIQTSPSLVMHDSVKLASSFRRYGELEDQKTKLVLDAVRHTWGERQRGRLLASTGSRLNGEGAEVRRRLTLRGERALRLRQVLALGEDIRDGDPLFDLRPVWMASPETVAQIFPRRELFDVVVFDEASQCRLEESLPVLVRAGRVVIAGDPKQLPPTRFFESAVAVSDEDEIETEQDLFEKQQGEMEDLLSAALNIEIDEAYLDVHYRSRNSDLIAFSNDRFYNSRLQAIPGHPANRTRYAPLTMYRVDGIYEKRTNAVEADKVCSIVRDLLRRAEPPSIGIASFNIAQRDLIVERLEEMASSDPAFAHALASARERRGHGSFEGLFVKNLENVQGDERDHIIISTTYGPDPQGRFYRRFGPIGRAEGGRRLHVLVTRARDEVHLVTSIPEATYRNLPPVPAGSVPGGAWLLFAYLKFAELLARMYEDRHRQYENAEERKEVLVRVGETRIPSLFANQLAERLKSPHKIGSDVHWGNDGFCVDLALHHPKHPEDVTIGVQCDMNRFEQAADPVEWEVFRNRVLETQGWTINRVWSPHFFRDRKPILQRILADVDKFLATEPPRDAFPVSTDKPES